MKNNSKVAFGINTFSDDALKTVDKLVSCKHEVEKLLYWVESASMILIKGPKNSGKTRIAFEIIEKFKGKGKVIYLDLDTYNKEIDIGHLIIGNQSFFRKIRNKMPKDMILIIDNAKNLDNDFYKRLQFFFDQAYLRSVVFIEKSGEELVLPRSVQSRIGNHRIILDDLSEEECFEIVNNRLNGFFTKVHMKKILDKSTNFETFLRNCEKVIKKYSIEEHKRIDSKFIEEALK